MKAVIVTIYLLAVLFILLAIGLIDQSIPAQRETIDQMYKTPCPSPTHIWQLVKQ